MKSKVFSGNKLFFLVATHGLPLDIAVGKITNEGHVIDWATFIDAAWAGGWTGPRINIAISTAVREAVDEETATEIITRVKLYLLSKVV